MSIYTADISDEFLEQTNVLHVSFNSYGKVKHFHGQVVTVKVYEDNSLVKAQLQTNGKGKVLVVDGGASNRCALMGDNLAQLAIDNQWNGIIIYGCLRDTEQINTMNVGVKALGTCPRKSNKRNEGTVGLSLIIQGTKIEHGNYLYSDADGILIAKEKLK